MDHQKVWMLLQIAKDSLGFPNLANIHGQAIKELNEIANPAAIKEAEAEAPKVAAAMAAAVRKV